MQLFTFIAVVVGFVLTALTAVGIAPYDTKFLIFASFLTLFNLLFLLFWRLEGKIDKIRKGG